MEEETQRKFSAQSRIVVIVVMTVTFVLGLIMMAQGFIDARDYQKAVVDAIQAHTGKTVSIKGKVSVALLPTPTLYIPGIELRENDNDHPIPAASADLIRIKVSPLSLLGDHPRISAIMVESPVLELVRGDDRKVRMDWLNSGLFKALMDGSDPSNPLSLEMVDGKILYHDNVSDKELTVDDVGLYVSSSNHIDVTGGFTVFGHALQFTLNTQSAGSAATPFALDVKAQDNSHLKLSGDINLSQDTPVVNGKLDMHLVDALLWSKPKMQEQEDLLKQVTNSFKGQKPHAIALPLAVSGDWSETGLNVDLTNIQLQGLGSGGAGTLKLAWDGWHPLFTSNMEFSTFDYDQWRKLVLDALGIRSDDEADVYRGNLHEQENPLPKDSRLSLHWTAQAFLFGPQSWQNANVSADLTDGAVTVNQFGINLPGEAKLALFGIISQSPTGDMRFEGSMETEGKSLREALTVFDKSASGLPDTGFGTFKVRSNIFVSSEQLRLSEADVKLSDLHLNGGLAAYFDTNPRIEADMKLKNINFDYFRDAARETQKDSGAQDFFLKFNQSADFNWLKKLTTAIDFRVSIDDFTFLERQGKTASFHLYVHQNEIGIHDINFVYPFDTVSGLLTLNVAGEKPAINLTLNANEINTDYLKLRKDSAADIVPAAIKSTKNLSAAGSSAPQSEAEGAVPPKPATGVEDIAPSSTKEKEGAAGPTRWSEKLIDMSWMSGYSGAFDLTIGKLTHQGTSLANVKLQADLANDLITFKNFTFTYWGGQCSVAGSLYGGKVPGMAINAIITNAQFHDMLKTLIGRENVSGNVSLSASLNTSGINELSWISQSNAKVSLSARGVKVDGVNVQGVIDAVNVSRTASDVFNSVNLALPSGFTLFSLDGTINVKNGVMKTPGIAMQSEKTTANLVGEVKLVPWTLELSTNFQFPSLSTETVPTLTVQLAGPMEAPQVRTDTSSLEAFVAKRIISK